MVPVASANPCRNLPKRTEAKNIDLSSKHRETPPKVIHPNIDTREFQIKEFFRPIRCANGGPRRDPMNWPIIKTEAGIVVQMEYLLYPIECHLAMVNRKSGIYQCNVLYIRNVDFIMNSQRFIYGTKIFLKKKFIK